MSPAPLSALAALPFETFVALATVFGLVVGSFLNVVIHRLPQMMEADWQAQAAELRGEAAPRAPALQPAGAALGLPDVRAQPSPRGTTCRCCRGCCCAGAARTAAPPSRRAIRRSRRPPR
jgi:hypothetical protein